MSVATLTTKGQVTIPKEIRDGLNLHSGDKIEFTINDNSQASIRPIRCGVDDVIGLLKQPNQAPASVEQMNPLPQ